MKSFSEYGQELMNSPNGERIRAAADSQEGQRLARQIDGAAVEAAVKRGDTAALKAIMTQVLSSADGKALAQKLQDVMKEK